MFDNNNGLCIGFMCSICETAIIHGGHKDSCEQCELFPAMTCKDCVNYQYNNDERGGIDNECGY